MSFASDTAAWDKFLDTASRFWSLNLGQGPAEDIVLTEGFSHHLRVHLRNLSLANALRMIEPARLVVVTGANDRWMETVWEDFELGPVRELVSAFGGETFDIQRAADRLTGSPGGRVEFSVCGRSFTADLRDEVDERELSAVVRSTWARLEKRPPYERAPSHEPDHDCFSERTRALAVIWDALLEVLAPRAFVTSHVDYDQWALGIVPALRAGTPVIHVQSTGGMKAYAVYPEDVDAHLRQYRHLYEQPEPSVGSDARSGPTYRSILSPKLASVFEHLAAGEAYDQLANRVITRNRHHFGRPSWWRSGGDAVLEVRDRGQREEVRRVAAHRLAIDPDRPILSVFNHAVSDAVNTNVEAFSSLDGWFRSTVEHAVDRTDVSWLLLDHPKQDLYDSSGFFEDLADAYGHHDHLVFYRSDQLTKNVIWSLTDLAITVRGSISNEMPSYGIGALQAGWSEWSHCGLSVVTDGRDDYWEQLDASIAHLHRASASATHEQMRRARLWQWFYRSISDVASSFVPHWEHLEDGRFLKQMSKNYMHVDTYADPLFSSVERMWSGREAVLLRTGLPIEEGPNWRQLLPSLVR